MVNKVFFHWKMKSYGMTNFNHMQLFSSRATFKQLFKYKRFKLMVNRINFCDFALRLLLSLFRLVKSLLVEIRFISNYIAT